MLDFFLICSIMPVWTAAACYRAMLRYDRGI